MRIEEGEEIMKSKSARLLCIKLHIRHAIHKVEIKDNQDVYVSKISNSAISKEERVPFVFIREGWLRQIG